MQIVSSDRRIGLTEVTGTPDSRQAVWGRNWHPLARPALRGNILQWARLEAFGRCIAAVRQLKMPIPVG